jgi:hypothetical protein
MAIHHLLDRFAFHPEEIQSVVKAYDDALSTLGLASCDDPATRLLAKKIIEIARTGERDPIKIRRRAIEKLGTSLVRCRAEKAGLQSATWRRRGGHRVVY